MKEPRPKDFKKYCGRVSEPPDIPGRDTVKTITVMPSQLRKHETTLDPNPCFDELTAEIQDDPRRHMVTGTTARVNNRIHALAKH